MITPLYRVTQTGQPQLTLSLDELRRALPQQEPRLSPSRLGVFLTNLHRNGFADDPELSLSAEWVLDRENPTVLTEP